MKPCGTNFYRGVGVRLFALVVFVPSLWSQGLTTAAIEGVVTDHATGTPVAHVDVVVVHEPSGSHHATRSRRDGWFTLSGLRVGGPYTVSVAGDDVRGEPQRLVFLALGDRLFIELTVSTDVVVLPDLAVTTDRDAMFSTGRIGPETDFGANEINQVATVRRNLQDVVRLDSLVVLNALDTGGQLSAQAQHPRYNTLLIDGVPSNDPFGLNGNGFTSLRGPLPPETIQGLRVSLSPYDVRRAGFTGALLNAVTKSGTNDFRGSLYYEFTNQHLRADNPVTGVTDVFSERASGFTLGGPLLRDRVFFFVGFDDFRRTVAPPTANFVADPAALAAIVDRAGSLGNAADASDAVNVATQRTVLVKLDWNISARHRGNVAWMRNAGTEPKFPNYTGATTTSLSSHWYREPRDNESYVAQLFSDWSPAFRTEASVSFSDYDGTATNAGALFPQVTVNGVPGRRRDTGAMVTGAVVLGTEAFHQLNSLTAGTTTARLTGEYSVGDHNIGFGLDAVSSAVADVFLPNYGGTYSFAGIAQWQAGAPVQSYRLARPLSGRTLDDAAAAFRLTSYGVFIQDVWRPSPRLMLSTGLRLDYPEVRQRPPFNAAFFGAFGLRNDTTGNGNASVSPRVGFSYEFAHEPRMQIRGGLGLFQGRSPASWLADSYLNSGAVGEIALAGAAVPPGFVFNPDPETQTPPGGTPFAPAIFVVDPDFHQPLTWKGNLALDRALPFGGFVFSAEFTWLRVAEAVQMQFLNFRAAPTGPATMPDGRIRHAGTITPTGTINGVTYPAANTAGRRRVASFADVFQLTNTDVGSGTTFSVSLARPMRDHWSASVSYTHTEATDVSSMAGSTGSGNYGGRAVFNPNETSAADANYTIDDRIVLAMTRRFHFHRRAPTTLSLIYEGRTGRPYSFVFRGDANGDGFTNNDRLYIPFNGDDPRVAWASEDERDTFYAFIDAAGLDRFRGSVVPRNAARSPWVHTVDLRMVQTIPLGWRDATAEVYVNIVNFGNLLNEDWGRLDEVQSYRRAVAGATYDPAARDGLGQYNYIFNSGTLDGVPTVANDTPASRWQVQAGMCVRF